MPNNSSLTFKGVEDRMDKEGVKDGVGSIEKRTSWLKGFATGVTTSAVAASLGVIGAPALLKTMTSGSANALDSQNALREDAAIAKTSH